MSQGRVGTLRNILERAEKAGSQNNYKAVLKIGTGKKNVQFYVGL